MSAEQTSAQSRPTLWHIPISHYNEKVRWALDYKGVDAERRTPVPGMHIPYVLWLTKGRGYTLPLLELEGHRYPDSTEAIRALEERYPQPPLYPADPADRQRALELEDFFDEEVGPYARRAAFHEMRKDPRWDEVVQELAPRNPLSRFTRASGLYARAFTAVRYRADADEKAEAAKAKVTAGFDRLETELEGREYLVGGSFTVADLTAASLLYPAVLPPEGPFRIEPVPEEWQRYRETVADRPGFAWVETMFARHRAPSTSSSPSGDRERVAG
jgi:glutathione S-transferase